MHYEKCNSFRLAAFSALKKSHMKRGINGDIINEKLNIMAGPNLKNRLWVTEFDVENKDIDFRTEDVK